MICDKCPQVILFQYFREWAAFPKLTCARLLDTLLWVPAVFCRVRRSNEAEKTEVTSGEAQFTLKILPKSRTGNCAWYSQAPRLSDKLERRENEPSENTTHVIWRIGRWLLSPQSPRAYGINFHDPCTLLSWSLEQDISKFAPIPTLEWTISLVLKWSRFFKWTSCPSENHLFGIIRKRKRWNHFHKREYDWSHLITLVHILKSKSYIVLRNVQYYAIDLPVDLYSETCQSHCGFIYKIKLKRTPSCSKKRIDSSMKRR